MEWISVKDRLPDIKDKTKNSSVSEDVLTIDSDGLMFVAYLNYYGISEYRTKEECSWSEQSTGCGCCSEALDITHWMSLPQPPKE
jgi:hypothetical protein